MEKRLKNVKKIMNERTFPQLKFTNEHRKSIHERINKLEESDDDIHLAILQLLVQSRTGFELTQLLRSRGIKKFENNEGTLYTTLHQLEKDRQLETTWYESGVKEYQITPKGRKLLQKAEQKKTSKQLALKELFEG